MRSIISCAAFTLCLSSAALCGELETMGAFEERLANFTIADNGRTFFTKLALGGGEGGVLELKGGASLVPFPMFEGTGKLPGQTVEISNAIGIRAVGDSLYVLDMGDVASGNSPKLVRWSISSGALEKVQYVPSELLKGNSFLQGFVVDSSQDFAVIADMTDPMGGREGPQATAPALILLDLQTGFGARLLENHTSFQPSAGGLTVADRPIRHKPIDGPSFAPDFPLNPIAISPDDQWVYYGAMSGTSVYRLPVEALRNALGGSDSLAASIQYYSDKPKSDGMDVDNAGNIYVGDVENSAVMMVRPGEEEMLVRDDERLEWPDSLQVAKDGYLYILAHAIDRIAAFNSGEALPQKPIYFNRIALSR